MDLFNEVDALLEVHAEVDELPLDAFLLVLLLLEDEHVMVEELLQTLVGVVDAQLLERVVLTHNKRARQLYKNISMLFLFPVKYGKLRTGVNAQRFLSCYG